MVGPCEKVELDGCPDILDTPADEAGDPLEEMGLTDCSAISYPHWQGECRR